MEKLRNWYTIHIKPVLPCLRMKKRGMIYITLVLAMVLLALDVSQMVWQVSRQLEAEAAQGYEAHLICRNITAEQIETLRRTRKNFAKYRDGAFEILSVTPMERSYDTVYDAEIRLILRPKEFYKGDLIVGLNSFLQNYSDYLLSVQGAEITVTPLYYAEADYRFSTFMYHLLELLSLRTGEDKVMTILDTEAPYLVKPLFGLDPARLSEATVHFARSLLGILCGGLAVIIFAVWLETEHMQYDFAVFSVFGADTKRLTVFLLYKMLTLSLLIQIPCAVLTYLLGLCLYGRIVFTISGGIFLFSMAVILCMVPVVVGLQTRFRMHRPVIARLSAEDNSGWLISPGRSLSLWRPDRFPLTYARLNIQRHGKFFVFFLTAALLFTGMLRGTFFLSAPPASVPQYTAAFPAVMEYEVYEERFVPDMRDDGVIPLGQIAIPAAEAEIVVKTAAGSLEDCRIAAAGETLYALYPEARSQIEAEKAVVMTKDSISAGDTIELYKPVEKIGGVSGNIPKKEQKTAWLSVYAYEPLTCTVGTVFPAEENTVYLSWETYRMLVGERNGDVLSMHLLLPEICTWQAAVSYKSAAYTDVFCLRCMDALPEETPYAGDCMDVLMDAQTVAIRGSRELLTELGYTVGDKLKLSGTGRLRLSEKEDGDWYRLEDLLRHRTYSYSGFTIGAVYEDGGDVLEIFAGPMLYAELTGIPMGYDQAEMVLAETDADTEALWFHLRQTAGRYYEVYIRNNGTAEKELLYRQFHRPLETWIIRICTAGSMVVILWEMLALFEERRVTEYALLRAVGGDTRYIRLLRWGCVVLAAGITAVCCVVCFGMI